MLIDDFINFLIQIFSSDDGAGPSYQINETLDEVPKKKKGKKIWEFLLELINNPETNPSVIKWENEEEGTFRFVQPDEIAEMWGKRRKNKFLTYDYFARALRQVLVSQT